MKKVLKTAEDYADALGHLHRLLDMDPQPGSETADDVELQALLIATYERDTFERLAAPTPIEAIRFRMEQLGLAQKDLTRYLGSASRASEVLSGKRPLTLPMIRALSTGLDIPAGVLIAENLADDPPDMELEWGRFPVREMISRGWIKATADRLEEAIRAYVTPVLPYAAAFRRTTHFRGTRNIDTYALIAWLARVWQRGSKDLDSCPPYDVPVTLDDIKEVVRLSWSDRGPLLACEFLQHRGVLVVVEPGLPRTFLDGATLFRPDHPTIGLTLRNDRLDSFWFTLIHELVHVALHSDRSTVFLDDLETGAIDDLEKETDDFTTETLIPADAWRTSPARRLRSRQAAEHLAKQLRISPAIVAGRIRRDYKDYRVLNDLIGQDTVRKLFSAFE